MSIPKAWITGRFEEHGSTVTVELIRYRRGGNLIVEWLLESTGKPLQGQPKAYESHLEAVDWLLHTYESKNVTIEVE